MLLACILLPANASLKTEADKAYQENDFKGAIEKYEAILAAGQESADVYYNLGNSYYKDKNIAKADKVTPKSEIFIATWVNSIRELMSESAWAAFAVTCFILFLLGTSAYIFGSKVVIKKTGFSLAVVFLVLTIVANMFADSQKDKLVNRTGAIVMQPSVTVKSTPDDSGTDLFVLHEGTKVYINDDSMKGWKEVSLEDGTRGWIPTESIEVI